MAERRLTWLASFVLLWGGAIFYKLISLQVLHHQEYVRLAKARQEVVAEIPAPRGTIFDRTGQVLAMSTPAESIYINPQKVDLQVAADILAGVLHMDKVELFSDLRQAYENRRGFLWIKRRITADEARHLRALQLEWIGFQRESQRHYPKQTVAAHVLGSVDFEEKGNGGIEKTLDAELRGIPGQTRLLTDVKRRGIDSQLSTEARPGASITLSLDERLQFVAERALAAAVEKHHAVSGSVVAMNPYTGDVLVMASYPSYNPNLPPQAGQPVENRMNHAVSVPFEPGSVFKVINLSAALETTSLNPESPINCHGGVLRLPGRIIHDSHLGMGVVPMKTVLAKSSNIGAIEIGMRVGQENMYSYVRKFGFGQRTGIQLPAESGGMFRKVARWGKTSLASVSMGQEVSVTTLQLAQAGSVIANGGLLVRPRLVLKKGDRTILPAQPVRVVKPETAITMRQMMEEVVLHGSGTRAKLQGYTVGGKTGSAQIFDRAAHHYTHTYNGSFMGFAPLTNPSVVIVVTLNGTHGEGGFGGYAAAPVFQMVATEALRVLDVPKDIPEETTVKTLMANAENLSDLAEADPDSPNILDDGDDEGAPALFVGPQLPKPLDSGPKVPNFQGKSLRAVLAEAGAKGLTVMPEGSGVARMQSPPTGVHSTPGRTHPRPVFEMTLGEILSGVRLRQPIPPELATAAIAGLEFDSRRVLPGSLFFAFPGARADGRQFAESALAQGTVAIASELPPPEGSPAASVWIEVEHGRQALSLAARNFYDRPDERLGLTGVTGTNGKTTTSYLIDSVLRAAGHTTAMIGTIEYHLGGKVLAAVNTTPESLDLIRIFAELERAGGSHATMEVSSHALALGRVYGLHFHTVVFTNLTRDHLDFHGTMEAYFEAKELLFQGAGGPPPPFAVLNRDDESARRIRVHPKTQVFWYGLGQDSGLRARHISTSFQGLKFEIQYGKLRFDIESPLIGRINVYNILAACGTGLSYGIPPETIARGIALLRAVPGRFERVDEGQPFVVAVDYAHTDDALRNVISVARGLNPKRVITLFGCGGDRDRTKRPLMGLAAAEASDFVVLTSDNPRSEDPLTIMNDALVGIRRKDVPHVVEPDRATAIARALKEARAGDIVILAGKGHETYQVLKDKTIPFDDRAVAREVLRGYGYHKNE